MSDVISNSPTKKSSGGHVQIVIGLVVGIVAGLIANAMQGKDSQFIPLAVSIAEPIGKLFLRLMQMMV